MSDISFEPGILPRINSIRRNWGVVIALIKAHYDNINLASGIPARSDTNRAVQSQKIVSDVKFRIKGVD